MHGAGLVLMFIPNTLVHCYDTNILQKSFIPIESTVICGTEIAEYSPQTSISNKLSY